MKSDRSGTCSSSSSAREYSSDAENIACGRNVVGLQSSGLVHQWQVPATPSAGLASSTVAELKRTSTHNGSRTVGLRDKRGCTAGLRGMGNRSVQETPKSNPRLRRRLPSQMQSETLAGRQAEWSANQRPRSAATQGFRIAVPVASCSTAAA